MSSGTTVSPQAQVTSAQARVLSTPLTPPVITPNYQITTIETVLLRIEDADGIVGYSYLWCFGAAQANLLVECLRYLAPLAVGAPADPQRSPRPPVPR